MYCPDCGKALTVPKKEGQDAFCMVCMKVVVPAAEYKRGLRGVGIVDTWDILEPLDMNPYKKGPVKAGWYVKTDDGWEPLGRNMSQTKGEHVICICGWHCHSGRNQNDVSGSLDQGKCTGCGRTLKKL